MALPWSNASKENADRMAKEQSYLHLHVLPRPICPKTYIKVFRYILSCGTHSMLSLSADSLISLKEVVGLS